MRTTIASAAFLVVGATAVGVGALDNLTNYKGSDTLFSLTRGVITSCTNAAGLVYTGSGSSNGETGMQTGAQDTSPMSKAMSSGPCKDATAKGLSTTGQESEGLVIALDGVANVAHPTNGDNAACGGMSYTGTRKLVVGPTATTADCTALGCVVNGANYEYDLGAPVGGAGSRLSFKDVLRVLYLGIHHGTGEPRDCNSPVRRALVSSYKNMFELNCSGGTCAGQPLRHAYRRDDASGTSDVFVGLLSIPSVYKLAGSYSSTGSQPNPFCNAGPVVPSTGQNPRGGLTNWNMKFGDSDFLDQDPIRVPCVGNGTNNGDQVCGPDGALGLVLTVFPPENGPAGTISNAQQYPTVACTAGEQELLGGPSLGYSGLCANGAPSFAGGCFGSVKRLDFATGAFDANCIQANVLGRCPFLNPENLNLPNGENDCRSMNLWMYNSAGEVVIENSLGFNRPYLGGFYRKHTTKTHANGDLVGCKISFATDQIGCLAAKGDPCSTGFAGREAVSGATPQSLGLLVANIAPDVARIQDLILNPATKYPLARKLYFNSLKGFRTTGGASGDELELGKCMAASSNQAAYQATYGFVSLPVQTGGATSAPYQAYCEDFVEGTAAGCTPATTVNACANNPAGIPKDGPNI